MISIVVCSINPTMLQRFCDNVRQTIGVEFEIIAIDNRRSSRGICSVYNEGAGKSKFPFVCFAHEDIAFETQGWGKKVVNHFEDENIGLLGIAGGDAKSVVPSSWSSCIESNEINVVQYYKRKSKAPVKICITNPRTTGCLKPVVSLDGVLLFTRAAVLQEFRFDEKTFSGFHGYDIDFSQQVGSKYALNVMFDIVVHHYSEGNPDQHWLNAAISFSEKWKTHLPVTVVSADRHTLEKHHWQTMLVFMNKLFELGYPLPKIMGYLFKYGTGRFFSVRRFLSMSKHVALCATSSVQRKKLLSN